eukprot:TRINITY_DN64924_c0_g1_i1.p1 TRINITY_DN64924_c0_g1~~TRINITY_DN64924_c0_g1_i1.p1  ORF type:complete len:853 (+),score=188.61 TRINITY_DN64924_c0_g1_i1:77-2560(+)
MPFPAGSPGKGKRKSVSASPDKAKARLGSGHGGSESGSPTWPGGQKRRQSRRATATGSKAASPLAESQLSGSPTSGPAAAVATPRLSASVMPPAASDDTAARSTTSATPTTGRPRAPTTSAETLPGSRPEMVNSEVQTEAPQQDSPSGAEPSAEMGAQREFMRRLRDQWNEQRRKMQEQKAAVEADCESLRAQMAEWKARASAYHDEVEDTRQRLNSSEDTCNLLKHQVDQLKEQLEGAGWGRQRGPAPEALSKFKAIQEKAAQRAEALRQGGREHLAVILEQLDELIRRDAIPAIEGPEEPPAGLSEPNLSMYGRESSAATVDPPSITTPEFGPADPATKADTQRSSAGGLTFSVPVIGIEDPQGSPGRQTTVALQSELSPTIPTPIRGSVQPDMHMRPSRMLGRTPRESVPVGFPEGQQRHSRAPAARASMAPASQGRMSASRMLSVGGGTPQSAGMGGSIRFSTAASAYGQDDVGLGLGPDTAGAFIARLQDSRSKSQRVYEAMGLGDDDSTTSLDQNEQADLLLETAQAERHAAAQGKLVAAVEHVENLAARLDAELKRLTGQDVTQRLEELRTELASRYERRVESLRRQFEHREGKIKDRAFLNSQGLHQALSVAARRASDAEAELRAARGAQAALAERCSTAETRAGELQEQLTQLRLGQLSAAESPRSGVALCSVCRDRILVADADLRRACETQSRPRFQRPMSAAQAGLWGSSPPSARPPPRPRPQTARPQPRRRSDGLSLAGAAAPYCRRQGRREGKGAKAASAVPECGEAASERAVGSDSSPDWGESAGTAYFARNAAEEGKEAGPEAAKPDAPDPA